LIVPADKGLEDVLLTSLSKFLSHKSFVIQPAPLINNVPVTISANSFIEGGAVGVSHKVHPAGIRSIKRPLGLFHLNKAKRGCICFWKMEGCKICF